MSLDLIKISKLSKPFCATYISFMLKLNMDPCCTTMLQKSIVLRYITCGGVFIWVKSQNSLAYLANVRHSKLTLRAKGPNRIIFCSFVKIQEEAVAFIREHLLVDSSRLKEKYKTSSDDKPGQEMIEWVPELPTSTKDELYTF